MYSLPLETSCCHSGNLRVHSSEKWQRYQQDWEAIHLSLHFAVRAASYLTPQTPLQRQWEGREGLPNAVVTHQ